MKRITLLGAHFGSGNMGVGALTMGALTCVKHAWPDAEVSLLEYDDYAKTFECRVGGAVVQVKLVPMRFSKKLFLRNNIAYLIALSTLLRLLPAWLGRARLEARSAELRHLRETDMVLSIAGGDSFSDIYGLGRFIYIALPLLLTISMKRPLVLMPQTIGPFKHQLVCLLAGFIMKHAKLVYARDNESLLTARALMGKTHGPKAHFCYDMGFILDPIRPSEPPLDATIATRSKPLVGLNVSGLLCMGGYSHNNMFALKVDYEALMRSLIIHLIEKKKVAVLLVPHVFGAFAESDVSAGTRVYDALSDRYGADLFMVRGTYDQNEIKYVIGQCDFFVGSRMHACIAALSQCIPAVGIAYSRKFAGVMQSIGMEELVADPRTSSESQILRVIGTAFDTREVLRGVLTERMPHVVSTVLGVLSNRLPDGVSAGAAIEV